MDNDRILIMDAGHVVELGHPFELLQNTKGYLHEFVAKTGVGTAQYLKRLAEESYCKRVKKSKNLYD